MLLISKSGENSTISSPTIPEEIASFKRHIKSILERPHGDGTETPGAKAGSRQSRSIEIYLLPLLSLDLTLSAIFDIPSSLTSIGVTSSRFVLPAFTSSSGSADLMPIIMLWPKSIHLMESVMTEP